MSREVSARVTKRLNNLPQVTRRVMELWWIPEITSATFITLESFNTLYINDNL